MNINALIYNTLFYRKCFKLNKRITMMLKEKSSPWARLKYLYVLPLAAVAVTAFARPEISEKVEEISAVKVNDLAEIVQEKVLQDTVQASRVVKKAAAETVTGKKAEKETVIFEVVEQMPEYPGGMDALKKYLESKVAESSVKGKAAGLVTIGFTVTENGKVTDVKVLESDRESLNKEAERIVREMPNWIPGRQRGVPVPVKYSVPVRFGTIRTGLDKQPLIFANGKEISMDAMERMNPSEIESVSVLKDSASMKLYGKRGENGVILVTTKKSGKTSQFNFSKADNQENAVLDFRVSGTVVDEQGRPKAGVSVLVPNTTSGAITDIDGHFSLKAVKGGSLLFSFIGCKSMKVPVSATMSVRMEQEVVNLFPETTNRLVRVRDTKTVSPINGINIHGVKEDKQPLVIVDGKEVLEKDALAKLAPDRIKSFTILKDKSATSVYGDKAKDGVIIVTMLTDEEYLERKNNPKKPYADALELADSVVQKFAGKVVYYLDDKEVSKEQLKGMSTKSIRSASENDVEGVKIVQLKTDKYGADWIPVTGTVTDESGAPVAATLLIKYTNDFVVADSEGRVNMKAPKDGVLRVGDVDKATVEVKVKPVLKIVLKNK